MPTTKHRFTITVDDDVYKFIEDYRFEHRCETKTEATTELIRIGLQALLEREAQEKEDAQ